MRRLAVIFAVLAFGLAGCGGGDEATPTPETQEGTVPAETEIGGVGNPTSGKTVFAEAGCGSCHKLADAGTSGTIGPSLDDSKPEYDLVIDRVTNGSGVMPSFKDELTEQEIKDVAAYVSSAAGS